MKFKIEGEKVSADGDVVGRDTEIVEADNPVEATEKFYERRSGGTSTWFIVSIERENDGEEE